VVRWLGRGGKVVREGRLEGKGGEVRWLGRGGFIAKVFARTTQAKL
jgi:hypothetical protein